MSICILRRTAVVLLVSSLLAACPTVPLRADTAVPSQLSMPVIFGDNMVLQQGDSAPVWGWDAPGTRVSVELGALSAHAKADASGYWRADLRKLKPIENIGLAVSDGKNTLRFANVAVGEVWLCSGQSNMELQVYQIDRSRQEIAAANWPRLRLFHVGHYLAIQPRTDVLGSWLPATPSSVADFSALGYFFGRDLSQKRNVPVGIVESCWGGVPAEALMPISALKSNPNFQAILDTYDKANPPAKTEDYGEALRKYDLAHAEWEKTVPMADPGATDFGLRAADADWQPLQEPGSWDKAGLAMKVNGVVWLRREVELPASWAGKDLMLHLGQVRDTDIAYFNDVKIGETGMDLPNWTDVQRRYIVPGALVHEGKNVILMRIFNRAGSGGIYSSIEPLQMSLHVAPGEPLPEPPIPLAGAWGYKVETARDAAQFPPEPQIDRAADHSWQPAGLWNGMIAPLVPFAIRGVLWYQGESNANRAGQYRTLFPALIQSWRAAWGNDHLPFLFAQVSTWGAPADAPAESQVAELREAQAMALSLPATAMAVTIDINSGSNIHPTNKQALAARMLQEAMVVAYGAKEEDEGPIYRAMKIEGGAIRLSFDHATGGLAIERGAALQGFQIAGGDKAWHWAEPKIDGNDVLVSSPAVANPIAVRYAWSPNWPDALAPNLANGAGLPSGTFRTDDWH